jgi:ubiquinone/menaquinone biosynthesis C-methylase UbiE
MRYLLPFKIFENSILLNLKGNIDNNLINKIESLSPKSILEISCGNGSDSIELNKKGYDIIATDSNKEYVDSVSQFIKCIQHDTRGKFPFNDNQFDLVFSRLGLHYFTPEELVGIFNEISRITKKYLVYTVKLVNDIQTGKVILNKETWEKLTSDKFEIISSEVKSGTLYGNQSEWLEITAAKKI